jgi:outer membrane murein-binding lipoprotein Lpp
MSGPSREQIDTLTNEVQELARHVDRLATTLRGSSPTPPPSEDVEIALARAARLAAVRGTAD